MGPGFARIVIVAGTGTPLANGTALRAALAGITGATATTPYVLKLEPGVFDLGTATLTMAPFVLIEGSGQRVTMIRGQNMDPFGGVVVGVDNSEIRDLTIEHANSTTAAPAQAFYTQASLLLSNITVRTSGAPGVSYGMIFNSMGSSILENVTVDARSSSASSVGIAIYNGATPRLVRVHIDATGVMGPSYAIETTSVSSASSVEIVDSWLGAGVNCSSSNNLTLRFAHTRFPAGQSCGAGTPPVCVGSYNASFAPLSAGCL